jgi:hypothetical protein
MNAIVERIHPNIRRLQECMMQMPQFNDFRTKHFFAPGLYARSVWRPANVITVGRLHKHAHFAFVVSGTVEIADGEIVPPPRYSAGDMFVTPAGTKRAVRAITDAEFMTIHRLDPDTRDLEEIERQLVADDDLPSLFDIENKLKDPALAAPAQRKLLETDK